MEGQFEATLVQDWSVEKSNYSATFACFRDDSEASFSDRRLTPRLHCLDELRIRLFMSHDVRNSRHLGIRSNQHGSIL